MKLSRLKKSIAEAERFLAAARLCVAKATTNSQGDYLYGSKENGATRRASMDLTRSLAELRSYE